MQELLFLTVIPISQSLKWRSRSVKVNPVCGMS
jgi:hypothetical protein